MSDEVGVPGQQSLPGFEAAHARRTDPATSKDAAASIDPTDSQCAVLRALRKFGPLTDEQMVAQVAVNGEVFTESRLRTARKELVDKGDVVKAGEVPRKRGVRTTKMTLWSLNPKK